MFIVQSAFYFKKKAKQSPAGQCSEALVQGGGHSGGTGAIRAGPPPAALLLGLTQGHQPGLAGQGLSRQEAASGEALAKFRSSVESLILPAAKWAH